MRAFAQVPAELCPKLELDRKPPSFKEDPQRHTGCRFQEDANELGPTMQQVVEICGFFLK